MVAIVAQRKEWNVQIVHVTEEAITAMTVLLKSRSWVGQRCFRITVTGRHSAIKLDSARETDVALEIDSQILLVMDKTVARAFAGRLLHFDTDRAEFCWRHLDE